MHRTMDNKHCSLNFNYSYYHVMTSLFSCWPANFWLPC